MVCHVPVAGSPRGLWDFFVSYAQADRAWAEWIAWILEEDGHRVLVQAWDFVPGTNWVQGMQTGIQDAARVIAVLSPDYLASVYGGAEWRAAWVSDPQGTDRRLLTVRVAACDWPALLDQMVGVDLCGLTESAAKARLQEMVSAAITGRAKPAESPTFPGAGRAMPRPARFPGVLPQVWQVPPRNPNFTGRDEELEALERALAVGGAVTVHSVHGMGGVGKTQLAVEYAYTRATAYDLVWWVAAEEPAAIPDQFAALAARLGLEPPADSEALRVLIHDRLRAVPGWLLVFDNADRVEDIELWLPGGPLPAGIPGHAIVTTRRGGFASMGPVLDLDVIDLPDAVRILRARVPDLDQDTAGEIAEEFGRLPLALEQAAAWLDLSQMPGAEYLELLRSRAADLHARGRASGRDGAIATLWDLSLSRIAAESPAAMQLLGVCAYLAPEPVPLNLFTAHSAMLPAPLASAAADPLAFTDVIAVLVDYSLAKRTSAGLQLHRLVQAATRARYGNVAARPDTAAEPQQSPNLLPPSQNTGMTGHPLAVAMRLLKADAPWRIEDAPENWPRWAVLLPHVLTATGFLGDSRKHVDATVWAAGSWLLGLAGIYLRTHARFAHAGAVIGLSLAITEAIYGPDHPEVGLRLNDFSSILYTLGRFAEAEQLVERALAIAETTYGADHPNVATGLNNLAQILLAQRRFAEAQPLIERALAIAETTDGTDDPAVARYLNILVMIMRSLKRPAEAKPLAERALVIAEATYGLDHPAVAVCLNDLALVMQELSESAEAKELLQRALAIDEATYGPDHPHIGIRLNNIAQILQNLSKPAEAKPLQERALAIAQAVYGSDHPNTGEMLSNLAQIFQEIGELAEARELLQRALTIAEATYGPAHSIVATHLKELAMILNKQDQFAGAQPLLERALAIDEATCGPRHPTVGIDLVNLAEILRKLERPAEAKPLAERALAIAEATYGTDHPMVALILNNLAQAIHEMGQPADAKPLQERALALAEAMYGPNDPMVALNLFNLGMILKNLGQPAEASVLLDRARAITAVA